MLRVRVTTAFGHVTQTQTHLPRVFAPYALLRSLTFPPTTAVPDTRGYNLAVPTSLHTSLEVIVDRTASENKLVTSTLIE